MRLILLIAILILKTLICKVAAMDVFMLIFWIKGRQLRFASDEWDNFFLTLSNAKVQKYAIGIYLASATIAFVITFFILQMTGYQHSLELAVLFFVGGLVVAACKWHKKYKEYILRRWREIPKTILEKRENPDNE